MSQPKPPGPHDELAHCQNTNCFFHCRSSGCRFRLNVKKKELPRLKDSTPMEKCPLLARLCRSFTIAEGDHVNGSSIALANLAPVLDLIVRIGMRCRDPEQEINDHYLAICVKRAGQGARNLPRPLPKDCGHCCYYDPEYRSCEHPDNDYPTPLAARTKPQDLKPQCTRFQAKHSPRLVPLPEDFPHESERKSKAARNVLGRLEAEFPEYHALLFARFIERRPLRYLEKRLGVSAETVRRRLKQAISYLRRLRDETP